MLSKDKFDFYYFSSWFENIVMTIAFVFIIYIFLKYRFKGNLGLIFGYSFCALLISLISASNMLFNFPEHAAWSLINYASFIPHYVFLAAYINKIDKPNMRTKPIRTVFWISLFLFLILFYFGKDGDKYSPVLFCNSSLVVFCIIYYSRLFLEASVFNLSTDYSFWVVTGVFCCMFIIVPLIFIHDLLYKKSILDETAYRNISAAGACAYGFMHLFFIKAFHCYKNQIKK